MVKQLLMTTFKSNNILMTTMSYYKSTDIFYVDYDMTIIFGHNKKVKA